MVAPQQSIWRVKMELKLGDSEFIVYRKGGTVACTHGASPTINIETI